VVVLGGDSGCPFHCLQCASCNGWVASFVRRCRLSVLVVRSIDFVLHFLSCIGRIVSGFVPNSLLFNTKCVRHDLKKIVKIKRNNKNELSKNTFPYFLFLIDDVLIFKNNFSYFQE
jgi:hypothetical protein